MDDNKLAHRTQYLAYRLFVENPEGKEFMQCMKALHVRTPTFPATKKMIDKHGGALGWAAFREGQITLIRSLDLLAQNYLDKLAAEMANKEQK